MRKGNDWNNVQAYDGESTALKPGGYVCVIQDLRESVSSNGADMAELYFDIAEGEYKDHYMERYIRERKENGKTKYKGVYRTLIRTRDGSTNPFFKGLITAIEKSNDFILPVEFTGAEVKGKLVGILFRRREWEKDKWVTEPASVRTVEAVRSGNYTLPEDKPLKGGNENSSYQGYSIDNDTDDDDLPF